LKPVLKAGCEENLGYTTKQEGAKADSSLRVSRAVPHPAANGALCRSTSEVEADPVHQTKKYSDFLLSPARALAAKAGLIFQKQICSF